MSEARGARRPWATWLRDVSAVVGSGALVGLYARVDESWAWLGFVALVPWLSALRRARSVGHAALLGVALGLCFSCVAFYWLPDAASAYTGSLAVGWLVFFLIAPLLEAQVVVFALVRYWAERLGRAWRVPGIAAATLAYVTFELFFPKLFDDTLGHGLYPFEWLRQAADIAGAHGLTVVLMASNELALAFMLALGREGRSLGRAAVAGTGVLACVLVPTGYGAWRWRSLEPRGGRVVTVAAVQASITHYDRRAAEQGEEAVAREILGEHFALSRQAMGEDAPDFFVWPETVYPTTFGSPQSPQGAALDQALSLFVLELGRPLVFGAYDAEAGREYNAAMVLHPLPDGRVELSVYRKTLLFPLTEWVPPALDAPWFRRLAPWAGTWQRGSGAEALPIRLPDGSTVTVAPLICYEAIDPHYVKPAVRAGAEIIITLSNDSWLAPGPGPKLHLYLAAFRSIATRLPQVRVTNSGISALIDRRGTIEAAMDVGTRGVAVWRVRP